jgi:arylsulfatase A-like enzyme
MHLRLDEEVQLPPLSVVIFLVDGMDLTRLDAMLAEGHLPHIRQRFVEEGVRVRNAVSSLPTTTYPNCTSVITGLYPGHHGIVGNFWFDRYDLEMRYYMELSTYRTSNDHFSAPTLFEMLPDHFTLSIQAHTRRGVSKRIDNRSMFAMSWFLGKYSYADKYVALRFEEVEDIAEREGRWPTIILTYYPGVDEIGHRFGSDSPEYGDALRNIDDVVGMVTDELEDERMDRRTVYVLVADHSHVPIGESRWIDMAQWIELHRGLRIRSKFLRRRSFDSRARKLCEYDVVGGLDSDRTVMFHLKGSGGWETRPRPGEVEQFITGEPSMLDIPGVFIALMPLDPNSIQVLSHGGRALVERQSTDGHAAYRLVNLSGDPLGYMTDPRLANFVEAGWHGSREWLHATIHSPCPDFVAQAVDLFDSPHTGDVVLLAAQDWAFADQQGGHGSCTPYDMFIPLFFAGAELPQGCEIGPARLVDVTPTIVGLLGESHRLAGYRLDGVDLSSKLRSADPSLPPG